MDDRETRKIIAEAVGAARTANRAIRAGVAKGPFWAAEASRFVDGLSRALEVTGRRGGAITVLRVSTSILRCHSAVERRKARDAVFWEAAS